jgi:kinesin family protein 5
MKSYTYFNFLTWEPLQSVLEGYNGTVMAYGQTGTGKTYTVGQLGKEDPSQRGIMVRALEHILSSISLETDSVAVSYLQVQFMTTNPIFLIRILPFPISGHLFFA